MVTLSTTGNARFVGKVFREKALNFRALKVFFNRCSIRKQKVHVWKYSIPEHIRQVHRGSDGAEAREKRQA